MNKKPAKNDNHSNNTNPQNQLNIQNNIFMENELNAIGKLSEPLAERAMNLLEKTAEHKMQIDKEIIEIEKQEQKNRTSSMRWFYGLQSLGAITAFIVIVGSLGFGVYLAINNVNAWLSFACTIPAIITSVVKLGNIKNHR